MRQNGGVQSWKPHALASPHADQLSLKIGDRVCSVVDLDAVPTGTEGRVLLANGFNWQRYRVAFANGVELGDLDGRHIAAVGRAARRLQRAAKRRH
jgi:hypothetical protein